MAGADLDTCPTFLTFESQTDWPEEKTRKLHRGTQGRVYKKESPTAKFPFYTVFVGKRK